MQTTTARAATGAMRDPARRFGLSCATITPFRDTGAVDVARLLSHLERCLAEGCESFTLFGTTGEGSSVGLDERNAVLDAALAKFGADKVLVGVMASAIGDAVAQADALLAAGGRGILLAPPFYFKNVSDEGLYAWFSRALEAMRAPRGVILYHLPSVTQVPLSTRLVARMKRAFPGVVTGVKDSGGEWNYTERLLAEHADLDILVGDERLLARAMRNGASGAINGFSNFCAARLRPMIERGDDDPPLSALVDALLGFPVTPGVKALAAHVRGDDGLARVAPPLEPLRTDDVAKLVAAFEAMPLPTQGGER
jgi:4-hydroxy-tetrahydrodipicolinate synthase